MYTARSYDEPISPYHAHQKLKRTKTLRRAETKKRNYEKKLSEFSQSNLELFNSQISNNRNAFDLVDTPSSSPRYRDISDKGSF